MVTGRGTGRTRSQGVQPGDGAAGDESLEGRGLPRVRIDSRCYYHTLYIHIYIYICRCIYIYIWQTTDVCTPYV